MAEPRKPRVIRTRPGTPKPQGTTVPGTGEPASATAAAVATREAREPRAPGSALPGPVRATSSKVSVVPTGSPEPERAVAPNKGARTPKQVKAPAARGPLRHRMPWGRKGTRNQDAGPGGGPLASGNAQVLAFPVPEYKRRRRTLGWTALVTIAVLCAVMAVALFSPVLAVKTVVFEGNSLVPTKTLESALEPIMGKPLPQITAAQVSDLLAPVVQVKGSQIQARPPSTLVVQLVERVPVALLKNGQEYVLVDQDGVQLGATSDPEAVALPLIDGGKAVIGQDTFRAMTAVLANLPQSILQQLANASASSPDAVELKLTDGRSVIWGSAADMDLKAQVLQALLDAPPAVPAAGKPAPVPAKVFDVSAPRHPVTR